MLYLVSALALSTLSRLCFRALLRIFPSRFCAPVLLIFTLILSLSCIGTRQGEDNKDRTARTRQPTQNSQNRTARMWHPKWDRQNRTGRTRLAQLGRQNKTGTTGQTEQDCKEMTAGQGFIWFSCLHFPPAPSRTCAFALFYAFFLCAFALPCSLFSNSSFLVRA